LNTSSVVFFLQPVNNSIMLMQTNVIKKRFIVDRFMLKK
jgi:hypothetical protein